MFAVIHVLYATSEESACRLSIQLKECRCRRERMTVGLVQLLKAEQSDDTSSTVRLFRSSFSAAVTGAKFAGVFVQK